MNQKNTFTKKDVIVVLICLIFLLANIAAVGEGGRKRAQEATCLANLLKWGQVFHAYTADNDGYFYKREVGTSSNYFKMWMYILKPYYMDKMMRFCPSADNPNLQLAPFGTWNLSLGSWDPRIYPIPGEEGTTPTGSYGMNRYVENYGGSYSSDSAFWRRAGVKGAAQVPVLMDSQYLYYWGNAAASPPEYDGDFENEMQFICINRHNGYVNSLFLDFSARKVGLKELWTLKHSRTYNTCGPWTICGNGGSKTATAAKWDAQSPWMRYFPEY